MSILGNDLLLGSGDEGYNLTRSLRFRSSATAYLRRTPASAGSQTTWTLSMWMKRGMLGANSNGNIQNIAAVRIDDNNYFNIFFDTDNTLVYRQVQSNSVQFVLQPTQVFRDPSAWMHLVFVYDSTQGTSSNRMKIYFNGSQITAFSSASYPSSSATSYWNSTTQHNIASYSVSNRELDGYLTEINFIDGQALTPSSFGSTNTLTGVWQPARYTGTYGTNGFYLPFTDNSALTTSSNVGLGKDFSGNGNYWTTNNISITSGVTYDSMTDVPTLTSATAANFGVLSPIDNNNGTISRGNLYATIPTGTSSTAFGNFAMTSGKWYWEVIADSAAVFSTMIGVADQAAAATNRSWASANGWYYYYTGQKYNNNTGASYGASYVAGDVIGITYDAGTGSLSFYKNNVSQGVAYNTGLLGKSIIPALGNGTSSNGQAYSCNFGQQPFVYTPPTGFVALNTYNLPTSTILKGNTVMDATLYTGTLLSNAITNAASFKPDLVWLKSRSAATSHKLTDSVRGVTIGLVSNTTAAETTDTQGLTAFGSAGFTVGTNTDYNNLAATYVAWQWQAGQGSSSSNTNGSITSTVSVNASAGFSIATYTGTGANATVGHGLGVAPSFIIVKVRDVAGYLWLTYHSSVGANSTTYLNSSSTPAASSSWWNNTSPTSSVFTVGTSNYSNQSSKLYVAYCWTPIAGFSSFGSYAGNSSTDGSFVYLGFRPKYVLIKGITNARNWIVIDSARSPYNPEDAVLLPNTIDAETSGGGFYLIDMLSNGFKLRTSWVGLNGSGENYVYIAYAENPFKNSLAR